MKYLEYFFLTIFLFGTASVAQAADCKFKSTAELKRWADGKAFSVAWNYKEPGEQHYDSGNFSMSLGGTHASWEGGRYPIQYRGRTFVIPKSTKHGKISGRIDNNCQLIATELYTNKKSGRVFKLTWKGRPQN